VSGDDLPADEAEGSEVSPGGSRIYRHEARVPPRGASHDTAHADAIAAHIERHLGPIGGVWHELVSDLVHVDLLVVEPTDERPFQTIVTSGMSEAPMLIPSELGDSLGHAELTICLPSDWPLTQESFEDEARYWPLRLLKGLARLPHAYDTWLGPGHTIPNGDPALPYAEAVDFCCALILPPVTSPREFWTLELTDQKAVDFYAIYPLYPEEMQHKLEAGMDSLLCRFEEHGITDLLDPGRVNTCAT